MKLARYPLFQGVMVFENSGAGIWERLAYARAEKVHTLHI